VKEQEFINQEVEFQKRIEEIENRYQSQQTQKTVEMESLLSSTKQGMQKLIEKEQETIKNHEEKHKRLEFELESLTKLHSLLSTSSDEKEAFLVSVQTELTSLKQRYDDLQVSCETKDQEVTELKSQLKNEFESHLRTKADLLQWYDSFHPYDISFIGLICLTMG
jgi:chromosome segregation ATPase